jgi:hypothetical protein
LVDEKIVDRGTEAGATAVRVEAQQVIGAAALMRVIQSARKSRFLARRSRYAYWPALMTACFAARKTLRRAL